MATKNFEIKLYTFDCTGCGKCIQKCKNDVLRLVDNGMCKFVNVLNETSCIGCGLCEKCCYRNAIKIVPAMTMAEV